MGLLVRHSTLLYNQLQRVSYWQFGYTLMHNELNGGICAIYIGCWLVAVKCKTSCRESALTV